MHICLTFCLCIEYALNTLFFILNKILLYGQDLLNTSCPLEIIFWLYPCCQEVFTFEPKTWYFKKYIKC